MEEQTASMIRPHPLALTLTCVMLTACRAWSWPACGYIPPTYPAAEDANWVDRSLITGEPCVPPCWHSLIPGESMEENAMIVLEQSSFVNNSSIERYPQAGEEIRGIAWVSRAASDRLDPEEWPPATHYITFDSLGLVSVISVSLEYDLEVQELIDLIGEPRYYLPRPFGPTPCFMVELYWLQDGLMVVLAPLPEGSRVPSNTHIMRADYFAPTDNPVEYWEASRFSSETFGASSMDLLQEWEGLEMITLPDY